MRPVPRLLVAALVILALAVAGCGRKPGSLSPPEDADPELYPRTYPSS